MSKTITLTGHRPADGLLTIRVRNTTYNVNIFFNPNAKSTLDAEQMGFGHSPTSILQRKNGVCIDKSPACSHLTPQYNRFSFYFCLISQNDPNFYLLPDVCQRQDISLDLISVHCNGTHTLFHMSGIIHRDVISRTTEHTGQFKAVHLMRDARVDAQPLQRGLDTKNVLAHIHKRPSPCSGIHSAECDPVVQRSVFGLKIGRNDTN